jgi:hypothetical protein
MNLSEYIWSCGSDCVGLLVGNWVVEFEDFQWFRGWPSVCDVCLDEKFLG